MNVIKWIESELDPVPCTSEDFIYNDMESQFNYSLPIIYQPFDVKNKSHWADQGAIFDFFIQLVGMIKSY
ncbi:MULTISPECIES: hypothetical protein [unclassified Thermosipho (in: thermotogales)]|uniref:hypothetical protein n=1 Tax=unclassified Thermosipho (in: thermotogales) TaxID=2676525 RepID=UPI0009854E67|nr:MULTISPECIES: hypothetical protein [unclassified Thermosipho (in: thermotogales)]MBT1247872.1 hypothetical protein [Thermosipho sp. 1244]OOC45434.1 hypothetical protein XO09_08630 [Thermosipho sp. 1223]